MKKLLLVALFVLAMFFTILNNVQKPEASDVKTYTITQVYGEKADFLRQAQKISKKVSEKSDGSIDVTLSAHQQKAWHKAYRSNLYALRSLILKENPSNQFQMSADYTKLTIKVQNESISTLALYMPQIIMCCEVLQTLEETSWQVDATIVTSRVIHKHFPGDLPGDYL